MIYESIVQTIGNTPVVRLNKIAPEHVDIFVKLESFNPLGSVKDRLAWAIIKDAENSGALKPGQTVVEATSGNTGIALAMVCAARGYSFVATMADSFSIERRQIMRALGAKVILTPAAEGGTGMVRRAEELAEQHGWFLARQFENPANPEYHRQTTAAEILRDFADRRLDYWVSGWGTGGTLTGVGEVLKLARPETKIIATEPAVASMLGGQDWQSHKIQGWTPNFLPDVLNREVFDKLIPVADQEAKNNSLRRYIHDRISGERKPGRWAYSRRGIRGSDRARRNPDHRDDPDLSTDAPLFRLHPRPRYLLPQPCRQARQMR